MTVGGSKLDRRRILIACYEVPGWGGASTATYKLFEMLQKDGLNVSLVNVISEHDAAYFKYRFGEKMGNPRGLKQVLNCHLTGNNYQYHDSLHQLIKEINPDLLVGVGWIAAYVLKQADSFRKLIYMTTGCGWMRMYTELKKGNDFQSFARNQLIHPTHITGGDRMEKRTIEAADLVVTHSTMNLQLHRALYASSAGKMYSRVIWFCEWIHQEALSYQRLAQPFEQREIDVLFIANDWSRAEKNYPLARQVMLALPDLNIQMVGEVHERIPGVNHREFVPDRTTLFQLMGNAKAVVSTSAFDAAPGILFEASAMACNVVASKNCGNWALCHSDLLADPISVPGFQQKLRLATTREFQDNIDFFNGKESYDDLKDLLSFF
jgi:glycosyltransferase involved in cell wall biosynthesis